MRYSPQLRDLSWLVATPFTHRGLHDKTKGIVENTSSAFAAAMQNNYAIECDVQLSADGEAMVFHDDSLDRVMATAGMVSLIWMSSGAALSKERAVATAAALAGKCRLLTLGQPY